MSKDVEPGQLQLVAPGKVYRDLDGSLVHLLDVRRSLCSWVPVSGTAATIQVTHVENFRRRFRKLDSPRNDLKRSA